MESGRTGPELLTPDAMEYSKGEEEEARFVPWKMNTFKEQMNV